MKKYFLSFFALALTATIFSCGLDESTLVGSWKVSSAKIESSTISENIVALTEDEFQSTVYEFSPDGKVKVIGTTLTRNGDYSLDNSTNTLKLSSPPDTKPVWTEDYQIVSMGAGEIKLTVAVDKKGSTASLVLVPAE